MMHNSTQMVFFLEVIIFASVIFMHLSKKSSSVIAMYVLQSLIIALLLFGSSFEEASWSLFLVALVVFVVKVIVSPYFFHKLIREHQLKFTASTYLNGPMTLVTLALLTGVTYSGYFKPLTILSRQNEHTLLLAVAMMLISVFLIINRKGALSQMIGVLSLENGIVSFACLAGLEQTPGLQLGILFDISVWVIIATVFASMVYKQYGSLDVTAMTRLKED
jgi:hydrogenase-4 component E